MRRIYSVIYTNSVMIQLTIFGVLDVSLGEDVGEFYKFKSQIGRYYIAVCYMNDPSVAV